MSKYSRDDFEIQLNNNFPYKIELYERINQLKEDLLPKYISVSNILNYYNNKEDIDEYPEKKNFNPKISEELKPFYDKLQNEEQIDEVKVNLYFILKMKCEYKGEYNGIIFGKYIQAKRLIIQGYEIKGDLIEFGPKRILF